MYFCFVMGCLKLEYLYPDYQEPVSPLRVVHSKYRQKLPSFPEASPVKITYIYLQVWVNEKGKVQRVDAYVLNNPLVFTDPSGDFLGTIFTAIWDFGATIFTKGAIDPWNTKENRQAAWSEFDPTASWSKTNKAWRIDKGLFKSDPNKTTGGRIWEVVSRFTWQAPQTIIGNVYAHTTNVFYNRVESVDYFGGATVINVTDLPLDFDQAWAVTLGSYILGEGISADPFETGQAVVSLLGLGY